MSNIINMVKINPVAFKERINLYNPLWYANHLSNDDKKYLCNNINDIITESDKIGTKYACAENKIVDDMMFNRVEGPFSYVRNIVRAIEDSSKDRVRLFSENDSEKRNNIIPISSDYVHLMRSFYRDDTPSVTQIMTYNAIIALSIYEFNSIHDVISIINAAGSIVGMRDEFTLYELFDGIRLTLDMLKEYLLFTKVASSDNIFIMEFEDINERMEKLENVEAYLSGGSLSDEVEHAHVVNYLSILIGLYYICSDVSDGINNPKNLLTEIESGYLYNKLKRLYYSQRDELKDLLKELVSITFPADGDNKLSLQKLSNDYEKEIILSEKEMGENEARINPLRVNPIESLTFKEKVEINELYKIKREDIEKAILDKIGVREGSFKVKKLSEISEELLAMYMAEFNEYRPLYIFTPFDRYFIKWDDKFFILFQLGSPNDEFKDLPDCLYAIRIDQNGDNEKYYDLIQMKKLNSVKYVFKY